ncbi:DUF6326 family protein [Candidatus Neomarinimicrobiota bacterium]
MLILMIINTNLFAQATFQPSLSNVSTVENLELKTKNALKTNAVIKSDLSTLWTYVTLNMILADVLSLYIPEGMDEFTEFADGKEAELMLGGAIMYQIPISMVLLSKVLPYKANRTANLISAGLMTAAVIGGGSTDAHYLVCASAELVGFALIARKAWKWEDSDELANPKHDIGLKIGRDNKSLGLAYTYNF